MQGLIPGWKYRWMKIRMFFSKIFLRPIMRKFIGCKNVAHHKNIFLSLSVLSWAHSSPCPLGLCGIAKKIPSKYNVTWVELVSKELNHLAAILHVYADGLNFIKKIKIVIIFQKENGNIFTLLIIFFVKISKRAN